MTLQRSDCKETIRVDVEDRDKPMDKRQTHRDTLRRTGTACERKRGKEKSEIQYSGQDRHVSI